jgi:hypothetical protein
MKEIKFSDPTVERTPKGIKNLSRLDAYIVNFNDGEGKDQTRLVFKVPGNPGVFILQDRIHGTNVATAANDWFGKAVSNIIEGDHDKKHAQSV